MKGRENNLPIRVHASKGNFLTGDCCAVGSDFLVACVCEDIRKFQR